MSKQLKAPLPATQHVDLLRSRGMEIDADLACQWLCNVSYYRLSAYWYPARMTNSEGERADRFLSGTSFTDVTALYEADRKLRTLVHDGMERVEVALRARTGEHICSQDPLAYKDPNRFRSSFDHAEWLKTAEGRAERAKRHNESIQHYQCEYGGSYPFWVLAEVLDFSDVSRLFQGLPASSQRRISEDFGIRPDLASLSKSQRERAKRKPPLVRWMEQLTIIRNTCAHHARLWNKSFTPAPTAALRTQPGPLEVLPEGQSERLFGALLVMSHLLRITSPETTWPDKVAGLLTSAFIPNPLVHSASLGIPQEWNGRL